MSISNAIVMVAVEGTRKSDELVLIAGEPYQDFPGQVTVNGAAFGLSETELIDPADGYCLAHYFRRDERASSNTSSVITQGRD